MCYHDALTAISFIIGVRTIRYPVTPEVLWYARAIIATEAAIRAWKVTALLVLVLGTIALAVTSIGGRDTGIPSGGQFGADVAVEFVISASVVICKRNASFNLRVFQVTQKYICIS